MEMKFDYVIGLKDCGDDGWYIHINEEGFAMRNFTAKKGELGERLKEIIVVIMGEKPNES